MKAIERTGEIDPYLPEHQYKHLWAVHGTRFAPAITALCMNYIGGSHNPRNDPTVWGYSTYSNKPKYRTQGIDLTDWIQREHMAGNGQYPAFFDDHELALDYVRRLSQTKCDPIQKR